MIKRIIRWFKLRRAKNQLAASHRWKFRGYLCNGTAAEECLVCGMQRFYDGKWEYYTPIVPSNSSVLRAWLPAPCSCSEHRMKRALHQ